jgi:hypothetical protein
MTDHPAGSPQGYGYEAPQQGYDSPHGYGPPQGYRPPQGYGDYRDGQPPRRRKRRRVFLWVFLGIQVLFLAWVLSVALASTGASPADIAQMCGNHAWYPLWKSYSDCAAHSGVVAAHDIGKGIALGVQIALWVAVDVILGVSYGVYRLATRSR